MILGMSVDAFTILHVFITLVAIGSGLIVVGGMFASNTLPVTTALFLFRWRIRVTRTLPAGLQQPWLDRLRLLPLPC